MTYESRTILGVFTDTHDADASIRELNDLGLDTKNISIVAKNLEWSHESVRGKGSKVAQGAAAGVGTGAALGALTGLLVSMGTFTIPGIGALFIGGPIAAALGLTGAAATAISAAASGALAGGLVGALAGFGLPREVAEVYEEKVKQGAVVLAVNARSMEDEADVREIFANNDAENVHIVGSGKHTRIETRHHETIRA
jgi:hypothetical protein